MLIEKLRTISYKMGERLTKQKYKKHMKLAVYILAEQNQHVYKYA